MLPRIDVAFASVDMSYDELVEIFLAEQYSDSQFMKKARIMLLVSLI